MVFSLLLHKSCFTATNQVQFFLLLAGGSNNHTDKVVFQRHVLYLLSHAMLLILKVVLAKVAHALTRTHTAAGSHSLTLK